MMNLQVEVVQKAMWMESHESYLNHLLGGAEGHQDELLKFS